MNELVNAKTGRKTGVNNPSRTKKEENKATTIFTICSFGKGEEYKRSKYLWINISESIMREREVAISNVSLLQSVGKKNALDLQINIDWFIYLK